MREFSGIVLAGGKSSRMGTDKTKLQWNHMSMLEWQVEKLRSAGAAEILLCGKTDKMIPNTRCVPDILPDRGPLGGVYSGLQAAKHPIAMVISADVPLLPISTIHKLLHAHHSDATLLEHDGNIEPLIGIYNSSLVPIIFSLIHEQSASVRSLLAHCCWTTVEYTGDPFLLWNCNTPSDYQKALQLANDDTMQ